MKNFRVTNFFLGIIAACLVLIVIHFYGHGIELALLAVGVAAAAFSQGTGGQANPVEIFYRDEFGRYHSLVSTNGSISVREH